MNKTTKSLFSRILLVVGLTMGFYSCDILKTDSDNDFADASESFTFSTTKTIQFEVIVNDTYNNDYYYKVEIFDRNPFATDTIANLLTAGVAKSNVIFSSNLVVPAHLSQLYIQQTDPLQRKTVKVFDLEDVANGLKCNFNITETAEVAQAAQKGKPSPSATNPKATDYTLPSTHTNLNSSATTLSGGNYYIPTGTSTSQVTFGWTKNSALYVSGTLTFNTANSAYMPSDCKLIILPGGIVTYNVSANFEQNDIIVAVHPGAKLILKQSSSLGNKSILVNDGTTDFLANFEIRANSELVNNGTLNGTQLTQTNNTSFINNSNAVFSTKLIMDSNTEFTNNGVFEALMSIQTHNSTSAITNNNLLKTAYYNMLNGGGYLENNCKVISGDIAADGATINSAAGTLISCKNLYANQTKITLKGNAVLRTGEEIENAGTAVNSGVTFNYGVVIDGKSESKNSPMVIISGLNKKTDWKVLELSGTMEYVLPAKDTPTSKYYKKIGKGISFVNSPTTSIEETDCNISGVDEDNGSGTPTNPEFPLVIEESNEYTFAMEDLWPYLGDYDMNDFVFTIHHITKMINSENKVIEMSFDITPLAAGSTKEISAALQFDKISSGKITVSSTNSAGKIESGQSAANIILFEKVHSLFGKSSPVPVNTYTQSEKIEAEDYTFTINFQSPVSGDDVIISNLNFYTIIDSANSTERKEIHLAGFNPSSKVKIATNNYKDSNNMVWAIMLPVGNFSYPTERTNISDAYAKFNSWAASAGTKDTDWYLYPEASSNLIYNK